ncbi:MAG TPA: hypothetical protein VJX67_13230 [Blastocatellia bacterium]|nr:hypothetical protein [Blastocatellia bacterium]
MTNQYSTRRAKARHIMVVLFLVLVGAAARQPVRASQALSELSSLAQLRQGFEQDSGKVRVVALLSPV